MPVQVPTRNDWKNMKTKHKIGDGAVAGVNLGKSLDDFHTRLKPGLLGARANVETGKELLKTTMIYLQKLTAKKSAVKDWSVFQRDFSTRFVEAARAVADHNEALANECELFGKQVTLFRSAVAKLKDDATVEQLTAFRDGPLHDLLAAAGHVRQAFNANELCTPFAAAVRGINGIEQRRNELTPDVMHTFLETLKQVTARLVQECKEKGLF